MANTTANGQATGHPEKVEVIVVAGRLIRVKEILHARNDAQVIGFNDKPEDGCWIEFRRKGTIFVPGLSVEGLASLIAGNPF